MSDTVGYPSPAPDGQWQQQTGHPSGPLPQPPPASNSMATAGLVLGIIAALLALIPAIGILAWILAPLALIFGAIGIQRAPRLGGRTAAIWGVILGALGLIICFVWAVAFFANLGSASSSTSSTSSSSGTSSSGSSYSSPYSSPYSAAPAAPAVPDGSFSNGTYEVGTSDAQIAPGRYRTTGSNPGAMIEYCAVIREKTDGSIIDLDNSQGGPIVVTVQRTDGQVQFQGDCTWRKVG